MSIHTILDLVSWYGGLVPPVVMLWLAISAAWETWGKGRPRPGLRRFPGFSQYRGP